MLKILPLILISLIHTGLSASAWTADFDTCDRSLEFPRWPGIEVQRPERLQLVRSPVRAGDCALRIELLPRDRSGGVHGRNRAELRLHPGQAEGDTIVLRWSLLIPENYPATPRTGPVIVGQFKAPAGTTIQSPVLAIRLLRRGQQAVYSIAYGVQGQGKTTIGEFPITLGQWHDLSLNIHWSRGRDGYAEVTIDEGRFTTGRVYGPSLASSAPPVFKLGQYAGKGQVRRRAVIYVDEVSLTTLK